MNFNANWHDSAGNHYTNEHSKSNETKYKKALQTIMSWLSHVTVQASKPHGCFAWALSIYTVHPTWLPLE